MCLGDSNDDGKDDACADASSCAPIPGAFGCVSTQCPLPNEVCTPRCALLGPNGAVQTSSCDCGSPDTCHVEYVSVIGTPCDPIDNGSGTATMPAGCAYPTPDGDLAIVDGLPAGSAINIDGTLQNLSNIVETPGGSLGGTQSTFQAVLAMPMEGTGALSGFARNLALPISSGAMVSGPRVPGAPEQDFPTEMVQLQGQIMGDPDFALLRITAGSGFGLPSPGHTTLTALPGGHWSVDSFFDITYRIDFVGQPGSPLAGLSGSTTGTVRLHAGHTKPKCAGNCPPGTHCERSVTVTPTGTQICCDCTPDTPELCPLGSNLCADLQLAQCASSDGSGTCLPQYVYVQSQNPPSIMAEACSCFDGEGCGPIDVQRIGQPVSDYLLSCAGACPAGTPGECVVHLNGASTGAVSIKASQVHAGTLVSCDCDEPPPAFCPLGNDWCANFQFTDCASDDPAASTCWPRMVTGSTSGIPQVLACDCFEQSCGPVKIEQDAAGNGFIYSCPGPCPTPGANCQIFVDNGNGPQPTGQNSVHAAQVPPGARVTCDCADGGDQGCCLPNGTCVNIPVADCVAQQGTPQGPGVACSGVIGACCLPDGTCTMIDRTCCDDAGGTFNPNLTCGGAVEGCCFDDGTCQDLDPACCRAAGGTPQGPGTLCQGDSDGDGHDDLCDPPVTYCPLASNLCANFQFSQCISDGTDAECAPRYVFVTGQNPPNVVAEACDCFDGQGCGPVTVEPLGPAPSDYRLSCAGACPAGAPGECLIHVNGTSSGAVALNASQVPVGALVSCDCAEPPPQYCPLGSDWCANFQFSDCASDDPTQGACWPRAVANTAAGGPSVLACDCFDSTCGPVDIAVDATGAGFVYSCPGPCPPGANCEIHYDNGNGPQPSGKASVHSSQVPAGAVLTCDCAPDTPPVCPLASPLCANLQTAQCQGGGPNDACAPQYVYVTAHQPAGIAAEACSCFEPGECGPVSVEPVGTPPADYILSCEGACPPGAVGHCEVFVNGQSSGTTVISAQQVPVGAVVHCDCVDEPPPVCPLESDWCANLQFSDCVSDDPVAGLCWPKQVGGTATGEPAVLACSCFNETCGPVRIDSTPTGYRYSCPGDCADPDRRCQIHLDRGHGPRPTGKGVIDATDVPPGAVVTCDCPVCTPGDADGDGDVDLVDFAWFQKCFGQPAVGPCACLDLDGDGDVDLKDFKLFVALLTGP